MAAWQFEAIGTAWQIDTRSRSPRDVRPRCSTASTIRPRRGRASATTRSSPTSRAARVSGRCRDEADGAARPSTTSCTTSPTAPSTRWSDVRSPTSATTPATRSSRRRAGRRPGVGHGRLGRAHADDERARAARRRRGGQGPAGRPRVGDPPGTLNQFTVDASGDLYHHGTDAVPRRAGAPGDPTRAIGVAELSPGRPVRLGDQPPRVGRRAAPRARRAYRPADRRRHRDLGRRADPACAPTASPRPTSSPTRARSWHASTTSSYACTPTAASSGRPTSLERCSHEHAARPPRPAGPPARPGHDVPARHDRAGRAGRGLRDLHGDRRHRRPVGQGPARHAGGAAGRVVREQPAVRRDLAGPSARGVVDHHGAAAVLPVRPAARDRRRQPRVARRRGGPRQRLEVRPGVARAARLQPGRRGRVPGPRRAGPRRPREPDQRDLADRRDREAVPVRARRRVPGAVAHPSARHRPAVRPRRGRADRRAPAGRRAPTSRSSTCSSWRSTRTPSCSSPASC